MGRRFENFTIGMYALLLRQKNGHWLVSHYDSAFGTPTGGKTFSSERAAVKFCLLNGFHERQYGAVR
jgi:hypothetical protein